MVALSTRIKTLLSLSLASSLSLAAGCLCGPGPNVGGYDDGGGQDPPKTLQGIKFVESDKGDPGVVGCADGQREGFADLAKHKRVAGCLATWEGSKSMRDKPTGKACGDDGEICSVPADACAEGWHVCGTEGKARDLKSHTSWKACQEEAGPGKFIAGISHGQTDELCPPPPTASTVFPCMDSGICSEPVCCGENCQFGKCRDAVWRGKTMISLGKAEGCGAVSSERNGGIMCCFDGKGTPKPKATPAKAAVAGDVKAADTKTGDAKAGDAKTGDPANIAKTTAAPTAPTKADPTKAAPTKAAPTKAAPTKAAPTKATPTKPQ